MNADNGNPTNATMGPGGVIDLTGMAGGQNDGDSGPVKDISTAEFMAEVIEESRNRPVLVDFWAPWCGPCKQLAPALESVVAATRGAVKLVKMNIDNHPEVASQMGIQSIPAVVAFVDGKPKDAFMGAQPEAEIRKFIDKLGGAGGGGSSPIEEALAQAEELAGQGQASQAANLFSAILQQEPHHPGALAGMGMLYIDAGDIERARAVLEQIPEEGRENPKVASLQAAVELAEQAAELGDPADLEKRIEADADDHEARFNLALIHNAAGRRQEAADQLLEIIKRDREWRDDGARSQLLQFFEAWGPSDPASLNARRKLSSMLFS